MCTGYGWIKEVPIKIKYVKKKEMGYFFLTHVCSEEEVGHKVNKPIFDLQKKQGKLLTIDGNPVDE